MKYKIDFDSRQVRVNLDSMARKIPALSRRLLGIVGQAIVSDCVKNYLSGQVLHRVTGTLAKSITSQVVTNDRATVGTNVAYAAIHEFGGIIRPKTASALKFKVKDVWVITGQVTMPERSYLRPAIRNVFESGQAQRLFDQETEKYIMENNKK